MKCLCLVARLPILQGSSLMFTAPIIILMSSGTWQCESQKQTNNNGSTFLTESRRTVFREFKIWDLLIK